MPKFSLSVLGPFAAFLGERPLTHFRTKSVQALLVYLACQPELHQREQLMTLLWPGLLQKSAQNNLRQTLHQLRKAIPDVPAKDGNGMVPFLLAERQTIQMNPNCRFDLDLRTFTEKLKGDEAGWTEAAALYRGDFLADFYLPESAPFEEWTLARRADLRRQALNALDTLTDYYTQIGDLGAAETHARHQLKIDNLRESAHRQLMELLARNGRRAEALSQYEACVVVLHNELAVSPSSPTENLYAAIRDELLPISPSPTGTSPIGGQAWLAATRDLDHEQDLIKETPPPAPPIPNNLPTQATPFVGREQELAALDAFLADPDVHLVTIVGPGGMGKTRLALACIEFQLQLSDIVTTFPDGIFFIPLARLTEPEQIIAALVETLEFPLQEDGRSPQQQILDFLRRKRTLLLFDNFEHLLAGAPLLADILQAAPSVQILVTSRESLQLQEEQVVVVQGLSYPDKADATKVQGYAAVQLFIQSARRILYNFSILNTDMTHLLRICQLVDGMPLGLELAASWIDILPLAKIADEIGSSLDILETDTRNLPQRHRSMRAVFDYSWQQLSQEDQTIFPQLSVFQGGFTRQSARQVTGVSLRTLSRLVKKSLLQYNRESDRYQIHELIRQYSGVRLAENEVQAAEARNRHSAYFCQTISEWKPDLKGPQQKSILDKMDVEFNNVLAAWKWALHQKNVAWLTQSLEGLLLFCDWRYRHEELTNICHNAVEILQDAASTAELKLLIRLQNWYSSHSNDETKSLQLLRNNLELLARPALADVDTRLEQAETFLSLGSNVDPALGNYSETAGGLPMIEKSIAIYLALGDRWNAAGALLDLGAVATFQTKFQTAADALERGLVIAEELGGPRLISFFYELIVNLACFISPPEEMAAMEQKARRCMEIRQDLGQGFFYPTGMIQLTFTLCAQGKYDAILDPINHGLAVLEELGQVNTIFLPLMATQIVHLGDYQRARQLAEVVLLSPQNQYDASWAMAAHGYVALAEGNRSAAQDWYGQSLTGFHQISPIDVVDVLPVWALSLRSREALSKSINTIIETEAKGLLYRIPPVAAIYLAEQGEIERAVEMYALAERYPAVAISRWYEDVAGREIAALAKTLPLDVADAARKRGRARDLEKTVAKLLAELTD